MNARPIGEGAGVAEEEKSIPLLQQGAENRRDPAYWRDCIRGEMFAAIIDKMRWLLGAQIEPLADPVARRIALGVFREFSPQIDFRDLQRASELLAALEDDGVVVPPTR